MYFSQALAAVTLPREPGGREGGEGGRRDGEALFIFECKLQKNKNGTERNPCTHRSPRLFTV